MAKKAFSLTVLLLFSSSVAWSFDGMEYANERIQWIWAVATPLVIILMLVCMAREFLPPGSGERRSGPRTVRQAPPRQAYQLPPWRAYQGRGRTASQAPPRTYQGFRSASSLGWVNETLYHGTPTLQNALDIADAGSGFIVGAGGAYGNGVYFADLETAKSFAAGTGAIVKVLLHVPAHQVADLDSVIDSVRFKNWCLGHGNLTEAECITVYALSVLRKRYMKITDATIYVALANPTLGDERVVFQGLTVLAVLDSHGNQIK